MTYWLVVYSSHSESRDWLFSGSSPLYVTGCSQSASIRCSRLDRHWPAVCRKEACSVLSFFSSTVVMSLQSHGLQCTHLPTTRSSISTLTHRQWTVMCSSCVDDIGQWMCANLLKLPGQNFSSVGLVHHTSCLSFSSRRLRCGMLTSRSPLKQCASVYCCTVRWPLHPMPDACLARVFIICCRWIPCVSHSQKMLQLHELTLHFHAARDTTKDVLLFLVQHSGIHSHCLFVIHHWHWLSSVRVWRLCYSAEQTKH